MPKHAYSHSTTPHSALPFVDISDPQEQERLSPSALKGFFNIMELWKVTDNDARFLLGGIGNGTLYNYKKAAPKKLNQDMLIRISLLIGIFKALNILHSQELADTWMQLPNKNPLFTQKTPLEYIKRGGVPALLTLRKLLDARRGGQ